MRSLLAPKSEGSFPAWLSTHLFPSVCVCSRVFPTSDLGAGPSLALAFPFLSPLPTSKLPPVLPGLQSSRQTLPFSPNQAFTSPGLSRTHQLLVSPVVLLPFLFFAYLFPSSRSTPQNSTSQLQDLLHLLHSPYPTPPAKVTPSLHDAPSWGGIVQVVGTADAWHGDIEDAGQGISVKLQY